MKCIFLLLILGCTACAEPQVQPYALTRQQPILQKEALLTSDNVKLPVRSWLPELPTKAVVIALHGMNDYSNAFAMPGEFMRKQGIAMYAYDQRGFGASPNTGIWPGEDNLVSDLKDMVTALKRRYPHTPLFVIGESMGGAVAIAAFSRPDFPKVEGLILSAPAVWGGNAMNPFYRGTLWLVAHTFPAKIFTGEGLKILASDNIPMLRVLGKDPLVQKGTRADSVLGLVRLMGGAYENMKTLNMPLLIVYGANDQVIPSTAMKGAVEEIPRPHMVTCYPQGYHLLLRDLSRDIPTQDVVDWILGDKNNRYTTFAQQECKTPQIVSDNPSATVPNVKRLAIMR